MLYHQPYGFNTRFEDQPGTNPEELIAAAHASCFTMALAFALERAGYIDGTLETWAAVVLDRDRDGFAITRSDLELNAHVPGIDPAQFAEIAEDAKRNRSEEHTSELQSLMRNSYAVFSMKKK